VNICIFSFYDFGLSSFSMKNSVLSIDISTFQQFLDCHELELDDLKPFFSQAVLQNVFVDLAFISTPINVSN